MSLTDDERKKLNANLDARVVRTREGGGGKELYYVEGWWVIDQLNRIIGQGRWGYECEPHMVSDAVNAKGNPTVTYISRCTLTIEGCQPITDHGAGHGNDRDRGLAIEKAIKEANTDALKRCAKSLGMALGLALYDKAQEHVAEPAADESEIGAVIALMAEAKSPTDLDKARAAWKRVAQSATEAQREKVVAAGQAAKKRLEAA